MNIRDDIRIFQGVTPVGPGGHMDVPLGNFASRAFETGVADLVGDMLLPTITVGKQSDKYYIIEKDAFFRVENTRRAPRTAARRVEFQVSSDAFFCDNYALAAENAIEDLSNTDNALALRENSTTLVVEMLKRDQEVRIANLISSISNVGSGAYLAGGDSWFSASSADIIGQVSTAQAFMRSQTGLLPNVMVVDWDSYQAMKRNTRLFEFFKYTNQPGPTDGSGLLSDDMLRTVFGIDRLLVGRAIKNVGVEDVDTATFSSTNVWGNNCILAHVAPPTGMMSRTFGGRFSWRPAGFSSPFAVATDVQNQAGSRHVEILEAQYFQDEKIIASDLAYVIKTSSGENGLP